MKCLLLFVALTVVVAGGCKKKKSEDPGPYSGGDNPTGMGAVQAVRGAVTRDEILNALKQIQLFIENSSVDGSMPSPETTLAALQKEAPKYATWVNEGKITLNRASTREEVWAYAKLPQGNWAVVTASGVEQMNEANLNQRLGR